MEEAGGDILFPFLPCFLSVFAGDCTCGDSEPFGDAVADDVATLGSTGECTLSADTLSVGNCTLGTCSLSVGDAFCGSSYDLM